MNMSNISSTSMLQCAYSDYPLLKQSQGEQLAIVVLSNVAVHTNVASVGMPWMMDGPSIRGWRILFLDYVRDAYNVPGAISVSFLFLISSSTICLRLSFVR